MIFDLLKVLVKRRISDRVGMRILSRCLLGLVAILSCLLLIGTPPALAGLNDDQFEGNIFILYAGNASMVGPRSTLAESLKQEKPALLVFYVDDSSDCKQYSTVVTRLQAYYGRAATFIPVNIDSLPLKSKYEPTEPGYYYEGLVPQTVVLNQKGKVVLNETGQVPYEQVDDVFREVFDLLPRSESVELRRRTYNEINAELIESEH